MPIKHIVSDNDIDEIRSKTDGSGSTDYIEQQVKQAGKSSDATQFWEDVQRYSTQYRHADPTYSADQRGIALNITTGKHVIAPSVEQADALAKQEFDPHHDVYITGIWAL